MIAVNERDLKRLLTEPIDSYHGDRTHLVLNKRTPNAQVPSMARGCAICQPRLGELHNRYDRGAYSSYPWRHCSARSREWIGSSESRTHTGNGVRFLVESLASSETTGATKAQTQTPCVSFGFVFSCFELWRSTAAQMEVGSTIAQEAKWV